MAYIFFSSFLRYFRYDQITSLENRKAPPFKYDANPVVHNRRLQHSGKISKIETRSKLIKVWPNGDDLHAPRVVLLSPKMPWNLINVMDMVSDAMKGYLSGPTEKLYLLNGIKVMDIDQITHNGQYVALKKRDRFKMCRYNENGTKNITTSPRLERKFLAPLNYSRSNNSTQSSPEHSNASTQNSVNGHPPRRRAARRDDEQVFPARPVKHTRSSEKNRAVDLDKDQGGMFKAKQNNRTTHGAREVQETRHTRTEVPVDQRQAKPVEDELIMSEDNYYINKARDDEKEEEQEEKLPKGKKTPNTRNGPSSQAGGVEARANSKRSPPTHQQQQQQKQRKNDSPVNHYDDFERQKSAAKIQAGFRGYKTRQQLKSKNTRPAPAPRSETPPSRDDNNYKKVNDDEERNRAAAKIQAGVRGHQSRQKSRGKQSKPEASLQPEDTLLGEEERAAAKIQAGFRGFQTRRKLKEKNAQEEIERRREEEERAAAKIQAGFRGYSSRKNTRNSLARETPPPAAPPARQQQQQQQQQPREDSYDSLDREIHAATKIQSSYRGYVARRELDRKREAAVILPDNPHDDNGINDDVDNNNPTGIFARSSTPPNIAKSKEDNNESQSPRPNHAHPRSPTPPQVSNDRAVDRFRSSLGDIRNVAGTDSKPSSRPVSSKKPAEAEDLAGENKPVRGTPHDGPEATSRSPSQSQRPSPSPQLGQAKGGDDQASPEPSKVETDVLPGEEKLGFGHNDEAATPPSAPAEVVDDPKSHGKQNGHAKPVEANEARENNAII
ncbi:doublecortin domain-containing protein 2 [Elysia marginata]|uniref:Doublecortin domain-containing protein 2 n=1 Tax=Elysia marginata TaxID=1093978 RepID=A0AAV4J1R4_9GAST|nr:doublecortin domain-containing protein 2 [Elysia marginata]